MVNKYERTSIDFKDLKLKKSKIFKNNIQDYIKYSEKDYFEKPEDRWGSYFKIIVTIKDLIII